MISYAIPSRHEGRIAIVMTRGVGCGGRSGLQRGFGHADEQFGRTAKSYGPGIPTLMLRRRWWWSAGHGGKKARSPGRVRI